MVKTLVIRGKNSREISTIIVDADKDQKTIISMIESYFGEPFDIIYRIIGSSFSIDTDLK